MSRQLKKKSPENLQEHRCEGDYIPNICSKFCHVANTLESELRENGDAKSESSTVFFPIRESHRMTIENLQILSGD